MKIFFPHNVTKRAFAFFRVHKFISVGILLVALGGAWWAYRAMTSAGGETRYVFATVERKTIVASVSASGQVSSSNQLDIKPKASGEIISINVSPGQRVPTGQIIAVIDPSNAQKAVRDAEVNLENAKLSLEKIKRPADTLSLIQAENALFQATANLNKAYDDGFNSVSNAFINLPGIMTGLKDVLYGHNVSATGNQDNVSAYGDMVRSYDRNVDNFQDDAVTKYQKAREAYDATFLNYRSTARTSDRQIIENLIVETYNTTKIVADAVKSINDFLGFVEDKLSTQNHTVPSVLSTHQSLVETYIASTNSYLLSLLGIKETIVTSKYSILEKTESLANLKAGSDEIDIKSAELALKQRQNALLDAQNALADYYVRAPFAGTIATMNAKKYDVAGSGTTIAILITSKKIAELSLNEVDAAKVSIGDKATLTFDAIESLTLTGSVAEIDAVGTVVQGVVSYNIKIGFDTQDERIKPGMTVNASIITDTHQDVLTVPASAVRMQNDQSFVQIFDPPLSDIGGSQGVVSTIAPQMILVVIGISDDASVEIVSGLEEGRQVVTRTISGTATTATTNTNRGGLSGSRPF